MKTTSDTAEKQTGQTERFLDEQREAGFGAPEERPRRRRRNPTREAEERELQKVVTKRRAQGYTWQQISELVGWSIEKTRQRAKRWGLLDQAKSEAGRRGIQARKERLGGIRAAIQ